MQFCLLCFSPSSTYNLNQKKQKSISRQCHTAAGGTSPHHEQISATISIATTSFDQRQMQVIIYFPTPLQSHTGQGRLRSREKRQTIRRTSECTTDITASASICRLANSSSVSIQTHSTQMTNINSLHFKFSGGIILNGARHTRLKANVTTIYNNRPGRISRASRPRHITQHST